MSYDVRITMIVQAACEQDAEKLFCFLTQHAKDLCDESPEFTWVNSFACEERPVAPFKAGDSVVWDTQSWWGKLPAIVLRLSYTGNRVQIKCRPPRSTSDHVAYVTQKKLSHSAGNSLTQEAK